MINRRDFLKLNAVAAAGLFIPIRINGKTKTYLYVPASPTQAIQDPTLIPKYTHPLIIPPAMPRVDEITLPDGSAADYYEITMKQFEQHILPESMGLDSTPVWSFVKADDPSTYNYPGFTIEATWNKPVRVKWINGLVDESGNYLPHLLPVDQTLHWANPPGPRDHEALDPTPYTGPVPMVVHVHGAHTHQESDGYPEAWYLPDAANIPAGYFTEGTFYEPFQQEFVNRYGEDWEPGSATFQYPNDWRPSTTWFHDHVLGITRLNVYAGPAAFYLLRGGSQDLAPGVLPGPAPGMGDNPFGTYYEIPLAIQDRSFNDDGTLFYPDNRAFFEDLEPGQLQIPFIPETACDGEMSDVSPIWNPEFFGNTIVVNGRTWPHLDVERRRYRLRILNGCNSRFLILKLVSGDPEARPATSALPMFVIGNEGGFLPSVAQVEELVIAPAERFDVIVDFSAIPEGTQLYMINLGPDEPYGGGVPGDGFDWADPATTGQVMRFAVQPIVGTDTSTAPASLQLPVITMLGPTTNLRPLGLFEHDSQTVRVTEEGGNIVLNCEDPEAEPFGPTEAHLGVVNPPNQLVSLGWDEPLTETPALNETEIWELYNFTMDAHPIHVHQIHFEVVNRQALATGEDGEVILPVQLSGAPMPPEPWEMGFKDTVIALPGEVTRIKVKFDIHGLFVWHCHILEHEDNEMMRPFRVISKFRMPLIVVGDANPGQ
jgi:spore coat protein A, manganese oxidase